MLDSYLRDLTRLIEDMRRHHKGQRSIPLQEGKRLEQDGKQLGYRFSFQNEEKLIPDDVETTIEISGQRYSCQIVAVSKDFLQLAIAESFGPSIRASILHIENMKSLLLLQERLRAIQKGEALFFNRLLAEAVVQNQELTLPQWKPDFYPVAGLNADQQRALRAACQNTITFLWGPPGTGKTSTLRALAEVLLASPLRLLVCSNTHRAVDQVLLKLCQSLGKDHAAVKEAQIIKAGVIQQEELKKNWSEYISPAEIVARHSAEWERQQNEQRAQLAMWERQAAEAERILQQFQTLRKLQAERTQSEHNLRQIEVYWQQAARRQINSEQRLNSLHAEREARARAWFFIRWFKRSPAKIQWDINRQTQTLANALQELLQASEQKQAVELTLAAQQEKVESLAYTLQTYDRVQVANDLQRAQLEGKRVFAEIESLETKRQQLREETISQAAQIVGATVAAIYHSPQKFLNFDAVVIDEASMVLLPALYYVAGLAQQKVVISGDFRQLSPIVETDDAEIRAAIGADVFTQSGAATALLAHAETGSQTVMLREQYRMTDAICQLISDRFYAHRLRTASDRQTAGPPGFPPFHGSLFLVDTSSATPVVQQKTNWLHAAVCQQLLATFQRTRILSGGQRVGICTPFRPQANLIHKMQKEAGLESLANVGTVHTFQGDENPIIIFDTREGMNQNYVSNWFKSSHPQEEGARLLNVAISRAQETLIFLANLQHLRERLPSRAILRDLLDEVQRVGAVIDVREVLRVPSVSEESFPKNNRDAWRPILFNAEGFTKRCRADLEEARSQVLIYSGYVTPERVATYRDVFQRKASLLKIRCVTRPPDQNGTISAVQGEQALQDLQRAGCFVVRRRNTHEKLLIIDQEIVWFGSLNPLSYGERTTEIMMRCVDPQLAKDLIRFLAPSSTVGVMN